MKEALRNLAVSAVCKVMEFSAFSIQIQFENGTRLRAARHIHMPEGARSGDVGYSFDGETSKLTIFDGYGRDVEMQSPGGSGYNLMAKENLPGHIPYPPSADIYVRGKTHKLREGKRKPIRFQTRDGKQRQVSALWTPPPKI